MSKDLFLLMREQEVLQEQNLFPKKYEIKKTSENLANKLIDSGEYDIQQIYAQAVRLKEAFSNLESKLKKALPLEGFKGYGVEVSHRSGGYTLDYSQDEVHSQLLQKLKDREALLKTADKTKEVFYDSDGVEIPKLERKHRKSSMTTTF